LTALRVIHGGATLHANAIFKVRRSRPGETFEPIFVEASCDLALLAKNAAQVGIPLELAFALAVESNLAMDDLEELGFERGQSTSVLNQRARLTGVEMDLSPASGAYLRLLMNPRPQSRVTNVSEGAILGVPARIHERLNRSFPETLLERTLSLEQAVAWEAAAVVDGRTLTEWALFVVASTIPRRERSLL
jgi:hypothetical protein